jgi:hypothetical protein
MTLQRPAARITIDGQALSAPEAAAGALRLELGMGSAHDRALIALSPRSPFASVAPEATLEIALGYGDDLADVFTGEVSAVDWIAGGLLIEGLARTQALSRTFVAQSYLGQSAADIVRDLLDQGATDAGEIEAPLQLHAYHVDERRSVWTHLQELARLAGCDVYGAADGAVCFRPPRQGPADHALRFGAELLAWSVGRRHQGAEPPAVVAYGAASESGAEAWHLVLREPDGSPPSGPTVIVPAVRDRDGARSVGQAFADRRARRAVGGDVVAVGDAAIRPGAVVSLDDLPDGDLGELRATAVFHVLDARAGFVSRLHVEAAR